RSQIKNYINGLIGETNAADFSVISINLIGFSQINDTFGFDLGDNFLKTFAAHLQKHTHSSGLSARLSADDFITVIPTVSRDGVSENTNQLKDMLEESICISGIDIAVSIRLGVSLYPEHGDDAEQLLRRSSIALHVAESRHIGIDLYKLGEEKEHLKRIRLISDLSDAIKK
ncbi:MAG: GGDEF domain-containing protein, partial [Pseudomonadales bacterium]|nr:GGDEF domain-containing protein [Pseudomonadales bacterium]